MNLKLQMSLQVPDPPTLEVWTDASDQGWGAWAQSHTNNNNQHKKKTTLVGTMEGHWSQNWESRRIEAKELWTAVNATMEWINLLKLKNCTVHIHTDSQVALSYLVSLKGGRMRHLYQIMKPLWTMVNKKNILITAQWIATELNTLADALSRKKKGKGDFSLNMKTYRKICHHFNLQPTLDCFATRMNRRVKKFMSWTPQPEAFRVDALTTRGLDLAPKEVLWCHPPWKLIPKVVKWLSLVVQQSKRSGLLLTPHWPGAPWWPYLLKEATQTLLMPPQQGLFEDCSGKALPAPHWGIAVHKLSS